jgi:anti-sigma B factor antagonist
MDASRLMLDLHDGLDGRAVVSLQGELDLSAVRRLQDVFAASEAADVVAVDLAELSFVDLTGIRVLHEAHQAATRRGARVVFVSPGQPVMKVLRLIELDGLELSDDRTILEASDPGR